MSPCSKEQLRKTLSWICRFWFLALTLTLQAQTDFEIPRDLYQYRITQWGADDGLPQLSVNNLLRTQDGYLWIGTQKGLSRFDGVSFENFTPETIPILDDGFINHLYETKDGILWIATRSGGLVRFDQGTFTAVTEQDGLANNHVNGIAEDSDGRLWIATASGVSTYWRRQVANYGAQNGLPENGATDVAVSNSGNIWVGTTMGLLTFNDGRFEPVADLPEAYRLSHVNRLHFDAQQRLWVLLERGLLRYHHRSWTAIENSNPQATFEFNAIAIDHKQKVWLGTDISGLVSYDGKAIAPVPYSDSLIGRGIYAMTSDFENNLWVGTDYGLIQIRDPKTFAINEQQGLSYKMATSVLVDRKRKGVWIGTYGNGLNFYKNGAFSHYGVEQGLNELLILSLALDTQNRLWIGTRSGLSVFDQGTFKHFGVQEGLTGDYVRALTFDADNRLWIGSREGLFSYQDGTFQLYPQMRSVFVRTLYLDRSNQVWVGTNTGLYKFQSEQQDFLIFAGQEGLKSLFIRSIYEDLRGNLWVGTYGGGLHLNTKEGFKSIREDQGLISNIVFDIREDGQENLWLSALKGIQKVPIQDLLALVEGNRESVEPQLYRLRNQNGNYAEVNGGLYPAGATLPDGSLLYPTTDGVQVIDPNMASVSRFQPSVKITSIIVDGTAIAATESFKVHSKAEKVAFKFTALSLTRSSEIQFKVKLEGFDRDWEAIDNRRYHYYTSLPPGQYTFRVMATNADGVWSDQSAVVSFVWQPRLYETTWFWLLCVALLLVLVVLGFQWRMLHLRKRERELQMLVEKRTAALTEANQGLTDAHERLVRSAHYAGMAEIATNVLHTIGNELNSVFVSISFLEQKTKKLRVQLPRMVAELLEKNRERFPEFLTEDPKGQKLIPTLDSMTDMLKAHQKTVFDELEALTKKITNIHNVVRSLPEHAEIGAFFEELQLIALLDEAIGMQKLSLKEHRVTLTCDFQYQPTIKVQRSKFLQVLVNLIKNAWEASLQTVAEHSEIKLATFQGDGQRVVIQISDNGSGIEPSEVKRIFNQGYTTKSKGNGFGLHFCGNVVAEMKGHIEVKSAGKNRGATFILDLPTVTKAD